MSYEFLREDKRYVNNFSYRAFLRAFSHICSVGTLIPPLGELALGGKYKVMPPQLRIVCAALVLVELFAIMIILQIGGPLLLSMKATKMICFFFVAYLSLNTIMCIFLYSKKKSIFQLLLLPCQQCAVGYWDSVHKICLSTVTQQKWRDKY